jgi:hypothetical protein
MLSRCLILCAILVSPPLWAADSGSRPVDFQREIRPILSQNCFLCHGPDENERKAGLRLDFREDALKPAKSGARAIVPNHPGESELFKRVTHSDPDELMPPAKSGKKLSAKEIDLFRRWIAEGAPYASHWAYVKPVRPPLPEVTRKDWVRNGLDYFIAKRLEAEKLDPSPEADKRTLIRRASLDLTGLPPTLDEVEVFLTDGRADAYERLVDRLLEKQAFGEHWARMWLDLARYADSAGYADDPLRSIWAYRDYVIKSFNDNKPFDQFTIEQMAGDLLPDATEEQKVATAFHRNTMTNSEGGTSDEEFRSVAVVDRVNTTMAVWMGTSMACAQCHTHKYDPITQEEYFKFYAILNNTEDADKPDESPLHRFFNREQKKQRAAWETEIAALAEKLKKLTPELESAFAKWDKAFPRDLEWTSRKATKGTHQREDDLSILEDGVVAANDGPAAETYSLELPLEDKAITALRLELKPGESVSEKALITRVSATIVPPKSTVGGRFLRIEIPGKDKFLSLAEVQVFSGKENIAMTGEATQSSTALNSPAKLAIDGKTDGNFDANSTTHTEKSENPWWELDLKAVHEIGRIVIWNRTDNNLENRLSDFRVAILDDQREVVWDKQIKDPPKPSLALTTDGTRSVRFVGAYASSSASGRNPAEVLNEKADSKNGWAPNETERSSGSSLTVLAEKPITASNGSKLTLTIEQSAPPNAGLLAKFSIATAAHADLPGYARNPANILALLTTASDSRTEEQRGDLQKHYLRYVAPELQAERDQVAQLQKKLDGMKPNTVPVMHELARDRRRKTHMQLRGNYLDLGKEVEEGIPAAFVSSKDKEPRDRLALAKWLVSEENPLTARVMVNRFWEQIFGVGIVRTSEEFGAQGEIPSHPELLDWLATEFMAQGWDVKRFLKLLVTSAAYRQNSKVSPELAERDPENRLLARGPRFRMSAEAIRDQALYVGGLLSRKMYGPSVKPLRPASGLNAAFGSSIDWKTSDGEDRFRRGLYTEWRRTSPYPSMVTFDAPNREVCTIRRNRTNTPLQALVTLNDPVYLEAAQGLALRMIKQSGSVSDRIRYGFELCVARPPNDKEVNRLSELFGEAMAQFAKAPEEKAKKIAPAGATETIELAAWTTVANVLLNLDETLMKR